MSHVRTFLLVIAMSVTVASATAQTPPPVTAREQMNAALWMQRAVEYRANALQAYRQAIARLPGVRSSGFTASAEQQKAGGFKSKPPAVILDIDETVLDNSPYNAMLIRTGRSFDPETWAQWIGAARAVAVPGAKEFISKARANKIRVVFISNRECNRAGGYDAQGRAVECPQKRATLDNLEAVLGYRPSARDLIMRYEIQTRDDSDKQARRLEIARAHRIGMLIGDDLNDFIRRADYDPKVHSVFWGASRGAVWIALPNAMYGSWEREFSALASKYDGLAAWEPPVAPTVAILRVVSWNLEWLTDPQRLLSADFWGSCAAQGYPNLKLSDDLPFCDVYHRDGIDTAKDYEERKLVPLRARLAELAAQGVDVFAVQEVATPEALQAVLPSGYQVTCFTTRVDAQNLGYAVRESSGIQAACQEIRALSQEDNPAVPRPARRGLELVLRVPVGTGARNLALLNVHLKSSCPTGRLDNATNDNCPTLQQQAPALEAWIETQANANQPFAIIGDWNRDLEAEIAGAFPARSDGSNPTGALEPTTQRSLWPEINDLSPPNSAMEVAAVDRSIARAAPKCHDVLDQLAVSNLLKAQLVNKTLIDGRVPASLVARPAGASDHCPLHVEFAYK